MSRHIVTLWVGVGAVAIACHATPAEAQESAPLASQLADLLGNRQLESFAGKDAADETRFVAVLAFPGQLLVVSAEYEVPVILQKKIDSQQYREVYLDLNSASVAGTKVLVTDSGADGIAVDGPSSSSFGVDLFDDGSKVLLVDGKGSGGTLSNADYERATLSADKQYSRMLSALIAGLQ